ncbi:uncharacterized protein LOC135468255 [Liolophura sinensis]|uniref:uncharacterized protein LOC135468255 n=1 Tax=Liolophura sinensis TaxID=3198878 RepID=UPI0031596499
MDQKKISILDGHSPVNKYKLYCLEQSESGRSAERITLAFQALEELVPNLGVYTKIFEQLRNDLFDAVYSDQFTGTTQGGSGEGCIQKIPFFSLVKDVYTARDIKADELTEQLETVKERLFDKHKQFEKSQEHVSELKQKIAELEEQVSGLEENLSDQKEENMQLEQVMGEEEKKALNVQQQLHSDITELQEALDEARAEVNFLQQYKNGYDNLQDAFTERMDSEDYPPRKPKAVISTKRANLISSIQSAQKLEQQLLSVLNATVEEFDSFMEEHKSELIEKELHDELTESEMVLQEMEIDQADQQLQIMQIRFKDSVEEMNNELSLTRKHILMLQEQLQIMEENKPTLHRMKEGRKVLTSRNEEMTSERYNREESVLSAGLDHEDEEDEMMDPFIPQERVFSKYAAMMYTSNNGGKTFHEFKEAHFCASCGEKTVVCPHKLGGGDKVMVLPHGCTHIKVARPNVRINRDMVDALLRPEPNFEMAPSTAESHMLRRRGRGMSRDSLMTPGSSDTVDSPLLGGTESGLIQPMNRLWDDFKSRTSMERAIPRPLSVERTLSLMEQFYAQLLWQDDYASEEEGYYSINDNLYRFMRERYLNDDVMYLATHDFLSSLIEYQATNKMVFLLCHVLVGNLDAACLRYVLLMADFIDTVDWREVADFRAFASAVYPFLIEDDLETLQMSYTSFSENKISSQLVSQFIVSIILKYREPRFLDMESKLLSLQSHDSGLISIKEFIEMMDNILPLSSDKLRRRLFWEAERQSSIGGSAQQIPILRVAQIASYLGLVQITSVVKENVKSQVEEWRDRPSSAGSVRRGGQDSQLVPSGEKLLTSTGLRNLAANIARRGRHRDRRMQDDDW